MAVPSRERRRPPPRGQSKHVRNAVGGPHLRRVPGPAHPREVMIGRDRRSTLRANARTGATAVGLSEFEKERLLTDALVYEGQQHWLHYRHIEQERNQFLGFFFTLLVAVVGFFVAISARATS